MPKKNDKSTAKVELDAKTVHKFESSLRAGLVASGAVMSTDNKKAKPSASTKVQLDAHTAARLSEVLRGGLVGSQAVMATDSEDLDKMTRKVKSSGPKSKKKA